MNVNVICCGKLKEPFWREARDEYVKRLRRYCDIKITEVKDEPLPERRSEPEAAAVLAKEGRRLLAALPVKSLSIALCVEGEPITSGGFSRIIESAKNSAPDISFVIGGTMGLSNEVTSACPRKLSLSNMTYTHQLARVVLLEQLYRAFKIIAGEPYHR